MPLNTYANLKASIIKRSSRSDISDDDVEDYITQAEAEMYFNDQEPLKVRAMEARATASAPTSDRFLALPDNFIQMRALKIITSRGNEEVEYVTPEAIQVGVTSGQPRFFTVTTQLEFDRTPDQAYTVNMNYVRKVTALSNAAPSNTILTDQPNIYLYGALWALFLEKQELEMSDYYYQRFIMSIQGYNKADKLGRFGSAPRMRVDRPTP